MRRRKLVPVLAAVSAIAITTALATTSGTTSAARTPGSMPVVPASAGTLVHGDVEYLWPRGSKHHEDLEGVKVGRVAAASSASAGNNMVYGGGAGSGNISTAPAVYVVFWGSQWSQSDPYATYLTNFLKGLYGPGDDWTSVSQQYCEGVAAGDVICPASAPHVGVPSGGLVKGVWFDTSQAIPATVGVLNIPTVDQMGAEAVRAAAHFGNTAPGSNTNTQYVVALPSKFITPGEGYYCAYHSSVSSNYGAVAYTNLPYLTDVGPSCGQNYVNSGSNGTYDGVSIVEGHEYMETITDMRPRTGWADSGGGENGDKCAWLTSGQGAMDNVHLSTGTFAVQSTWSNAFNNGAAGCVTHNP